MDIQPIHEWLWVKNPIYVDFGQQAANTLNYATIRIQQAFTVLWESIYVAKNDYLKCDISGAASKLFELIPDDNAANPGNCPAETFRTLTLRITVNEAEDTIMNELRTFVYGGKEIIDSFDIDTYFPGTTAVDFLSEFERPLIWVDHPFQLCFAKTGTFEEIQVKAFDQNNTQIDSAVIEVGGNGTGNDILKVRPITESDIEGLQAAEYLTVGDGGTTLNDIRCYIKRGDIPGGVMLRWINRLGGYDQYYFILKDTKRPTQTVTVPLPRDIEYMDKWNKGVAKVVDKEKATIYTLGALHVPVADYRVISRISESDRVDMYMGSGSWMQVIVNDSDWNVSHENDYQDIEFTVTTI